MTRFDIEAAWSTMSDGQCEGELGFLDVNDCEPLDCHESGEPVDQWCPWCIGWVAVCELRDALRLAKTKEET